DAGFPGDPEHLRERRVDPIPLGTLMGEVHATAGGRDLRAGDDLVGGVVEIGNVLQRRGDSERAVFHGLRDERLHSVELGRAGSPILCSDDHPAEPPEPDERAEVDRGGGPPEPHEVREERRPVRPEAVVSVRVFVALEQRFVEGCDGLALARDLGRDSLRDLGGRAPVDQGVVLGLAEEVDEPRRDDEAGGIDPATGAGDPVWPEIAYRGDAAVPDGHVPAECRFPRAVYDPPASEHEIVPAGRGAREKKKGPDRQGRSPKKTSHAAGAPFGNPQPAPAQRGPRGPRGSSVFGRASLTRIVRPSCCDPLSAWMAFWASASLISTKPNPLERPDSRSATTVADSTAPWGSKRVRREASFTP